MGAALTLLAYLDPGSGDSGSQIVVAVIAFVVVAALILLVVFLVRRARTRDCPRCGSRVERGQLECGSCGFDFRTIGSEAG